MNKTTTKSYIVNRLKNSGYNIDRLDSLEYTEDDKRQWTVIVDNGVSSIFLTCMKDDSFQFYDGGRFFNSYHKLNLPSDEDWGFEVLVEYLHDKGIINKHYKYETATSWLSE